MTFAYLKLSLLLLPLLLSGPTLTSERADPIAVDIRVPETGRVGETLSTSLIFTNVGAEPLYLEFGGADFGPDSLVLCAFDGNQWFRSGRAHFDRDVAAHRFDFIPLRLGQRFESPILSVNGADGGALPNLRLPHAGRYELFARFTSNGSGNEGGIWPIWRGTTISPRHTVTLSPPLDATVRTNRALLTQCVEQPTECAPEVIGFFSIVRDREAAALLITMLDSTAIPDPSLAGAVANQADDRSAQALRRFGARFPPYIELVSALLAERTEAATECSVGSNQRRSAKE